MWNSLSRAEQLLNDASYSGRSAGKFHEVAKEEELYEHENIEYVLPDIDSATSM